MRSQAGGVVLQVDESMFIYIFYSNFTYNLLSILRNFLRFVLYFVCGTCESTLGKKKS